MKNSEYCWTKRFQIKTNKTLYILFIFFSIQNIYSQKIFQISKIEGCQVLYPNLTIEEAQSRAIVQAKINALQEAGISEQISSNQFYEVERGKRVNKDKFYESTSSDIKGEVVKFDLMGFTQTVGSNGEILICAQAKIDVLKHDIQRNNIGSLELSGINDKYKKGDVLELKLKSNTDMYYWVFLIDSDEKYQLLYPISKFESNKILKNQLVLLPNANDYKWNADTVKLEEINSILIVYSNENKIMGENNISDFNSWSDWYQKLDYSSRNKIIKTFKIYK
jgi:hypothetical protein